MKRVLPLAMATARTITSRRAQRRIDSGRLNILVLLSHLAVAPWRREGRRWLPGRQRARTLGPLWIGAALFVRGRCHPTAEPRCTATSAAAPLPTRPAWARNR